MLAEWPSSLEMLKKGEFGSFFSGIGRLDLAMVANESAKHPSPDQGLDQFLARLPSQPIPPADLEVDPPNLDLGSLKPGSDIKCSVKIRNKGRRILYGSVTIEGIPWLTIGEGKPRSRSRFQTFQDAPLPLMVRSSALRASDKPVEGSLIFETSGGNIIVPVTAQIPFRPFLLGALAGAKSPRQIAEKAKSNPTAAAIMFENGSVSRWYKDNGLTYPVPGPSASGVAAVQQFFEALGLAKPPKVFINTTALVFELEEGEVKVQTLVISSEEKKMVYAQAEVGAPWIKIGKPEMKGNRVSLTVSVSAHEVSEDESSWIKVHSNGNQIFKVAVMAQAKSSAFADLMGDVTPVAPTAQELLQGVGANRPDGQENNTGGEYASAPILTVHSLARKVKGNQWKTYIFIIFFATCLICLLGAIAFLAMKKVGSGKAVPANKV